jgi:hypothetical protein
MSYENTSLTTNLDASGQQRTNSTGAVGVLTFAGLLMIMVGIFHAIQGVVALFNNSFYVVGEEYLFKVDVTAYGWIHIILGLVVAGAGFGLFRGAVWARTVAVIVASVSMVASFVSIPYYPIWSVMLIIFDVFVIWAAILHGRDIVNE